MLTAGERLVQILDEATRIFSVDSDPTVTFQGVEYTLVDMVFLKVGVNAALAETFRQEVDRLLNSSELLLGVLIMQAKTGYQQIAAAWEMDQLCVLRLLGFGFVLKMWELLNPSDLGISGHDAVMSAQNGGFVILSPILSR